MNKYFSNIIVYTYIIPNGFIFFLTIRGRSTIWFCVSIYGNQHIFVSMATTYIDLHWLKNPSYSMRQWYTHFCPIELKSTSLYYNVLYKIQLKFCNVKFFFLFWTNIQIFAESSSMTPTGSRQSCQPCQIFRQTLYLNINPEAVSFVYRVLSWNLQQVFIHMLALLRLKTPYAQILSCQTLSGAELQHLLLNNLSKIS